jgi:hypothetical protein
VLASTLLVFGHAMSRYRAGERRHLFRWLVITVYGVAMELIAFNFLENYEHAQFTVQLYGGQLPLYVTGLYGSFLYTGIELAERLGVHPALEALVAGLAMCLIDVPFDLAGVALGWWTWLDTDPVLAYRWLDVPVTSYYWYLAFGAVAALLCRFLYRPALERNFAWAIPLALAGGLGIIFFGVLAFLPFHGLHALGLSHGAVVALHIALVAVAALIARGAPRPLPRPIAAVIAVLPGSMLAVLIAAALGASSSQGDLALRVLASLSAVAGLGALGWALPRVRATEAQPPANEPAPAE